MDKLRLILLREKDDFSWGKFFVLFVWRGLKIKGIDWGFEFIIFVLFVVVFGIL